VVGALEVLLSPLAVRLLLVRACAALETDADLLGKPAEVWVDLPHLAEARRQLAAELSALIDASFDPAREDEAAARAAPAETTDIPF
jgi:hypothetical protein